jgi:ATP-dependent Lon protease
MSNPNTLPETVELPLLPLRDVVVFPHMVIPLFVGRPKSIKALEMAMEGGKNILLWPRNRPPRTNRNRKISTVSAAWPISCRCSSCPTAPSRCWSKARSARASKPSRCNPRVHGHRYPLPQPGVEDHEIEAMRRAVVAQFDQFVKLNKKIPPEVLSSIAGIEDAGRLADTIAAHLPLKLEQKQEVLEMESIRDRLTACCHNSNLKSTFCRSKSASVAASSARWKRASASTT